MATPSKEQIRDAAAKKAKAAVRRKQFYKVQGEPSTLMPLAAGHDVQLRIKR